MSRIKRRRLGTCQPNLHKNYWCPREESNLNLGDYEAAARRPIPLTALNSRISIAGDGASVPMAEALRTPVPLVSGCDCRFALVSCGTSAFTVVGTVNGVSTYLVVSGNADDVAKLKDSYVSGGGSGRILDGDQHSGPLICEHDSAKNGHHLHFALYGSTLSAEQCQQIFAAFP